MNRFKSLVLFFFFLAIIFLDFSPEVAADDIYEDNDTFGTAKEISKGIHSNLNCSDNDWYKYYTKKNCGIMIQIDFLNSSGNLGLELYTNLTVLLDSSDDIFDFEMVTATASYSGYYFIHVYTNDNYNVTYELSIGDICPECDWGYEYNIYANKADVIIWEITRVNKTIMELVFGSDWNTTGVENDEVGAQMKVEFEEITIDTEEDCEWDIRYKLWIWTINTNDFSGAADNETTLFLSLYGGSENTPPIFICPVIVNDYIQSFEYKKEFEVNNNKLNYTTWALKNYSQIIRYNEKTGVVEKNQIIHNNTIIWESSLKFTTISQSKENADEKVKAIPGISISIIIGTLSLYVVVFILIYLTKKRK